MENFHQVCFVKCFLLSSLSLLLIQGAPTMIDAEHEKPQTDVISTTDHDMECRIRSSCSSSSIPVCPQTNPMTVDPDSYIPLNCAIFNGELVEGMTWKEAKQALENSTGSLDLVLHKVLTNNGKDSCQCAAITFTRALQIVWATNSPNSIIKGKGKNLTCVFSGWPLPRTVYWYKDGELIIDGTEHIYFSEDKNGEKTLHSILNLPRGLEEQEGIYNCRATNSLPGWSSSASEVIQMIYECPLPSSPADPQTIQASTFSNVNLPCSVYFDAYCPESLFWYLNDNKRPLPESGEKYKVEVKGTHTRCTKEFILSIFNVTKSDEGRYSCQWNCEYESTMKAAIYLVVDEEGVLD